jgi:ABC-type multidrug transport system fused ATPase/permease subunit
MSFSIGPSSPGMGPRSALDHFGSAGEQGGEVFNRRVVGRMLAYLRPHQWKMLVALILTLIQSGLTLLSPYLVKVAIDQYITPKDQNGLLNISLLIAANFIALFFVSSGQGYLISWVGQRVLATLRDELFRHLQDLQLGYNDRHIVGVTVSRVINDVAEINELLSQGIISLLGDVIVLVGIVVIMISMSQAKVLRFCRMMLCSGIRMVRH